MTNLHELLEKVRMARLRLPPNEATLLFAAALRLAAAQQGTLRARLLQIDESGGLHLEPFDDQVPESEPGYLAPELNAPDAPPKDEPRVQVYAAGALGFQLFTGHVPPGNLAELTGPLADILRIALAPDRRERFGDLKQLQEALEAVQPRPPGQGERNIFSALRSRWTRPPPEKEAVARLIEKLSQLEAQVAQLSKAQSRLDAGQRQALEQLDRFEGGQRMQRPPPSAIGPALLAGLLSAAVVVAVGLGFGWISAPRSPPPVEAAQAGKPAADVAPRAQEPAGDAPAAKAAAGAAEKSAPAGGAEMSAPGGGAEKSAPAAAAEKSAPAAAAEKSAPAAAAEKSAPKVAADKSAPAPGEPPAAEGAERSAPEAATDKSAPAAAGKESSVAGAGEKSAPPAAALDQAPPAAAADKPPSAAEAPPEAAEEKSNQPAPPPSKSPAPAKRRPEVTQAQLLHAVAISQVRRGESALVKGNADEALASFQAALENEATLPVAFRGLGMAYAMQGRDAMALRAYEKYLQLAPGAPDRGEIRRSMGELKTRSKTGEK